MKVDLVSSSKFLSLILRHKPEKIGIKLDKNGWANVDELLEKLALNNHHIDMVDLEEIVATNNKKRFIFNDDKTKIRANQGHSINVDVQLKSSIPPPTLYHGTASVNIKSIMKHGLEKRNRLHVHLSADEATAINVGKRHSVNIKVLVIDTAMMVKDGFKFFKSENGVWLTDHVPPKYIS